MLPNSWPGTPPFASAVISTRSCSLRKTSRMISRNGLPISTCTWTATPRRRVGATKEPNSRRRAATTTCWRSGGHATVIQDPSESGKTSTTHSEASFVAASASARPSAASGLVVSFA